MLRYLTDAKRKHSRILWVNLREEVVLEGNEQVYTLREPGSLDELVPVPASTPEQLEVSLGFWGASSCLGAGGTRGGWTKVAPGRWGMLPSAASGCAADLLLASVVPFLFFMLPNVTLWPI